MDGLYYNVFFRNCEVETSVSTVMTYLVSQLQVTV